MPHSALLVEDSQTIRDSLIPTIRELAGIEVVGVAESPQEAIVLAQERNWSLMILDLFLKDGSGLNVLEALHGRTHGQRIVVLTNYATPDVRVRCAALGSDAVFDKSTELDDFFDYCIGFSTSWAPLVS
ncbi:MAG: response regulator [Comamonadaceae bacterium]|nr:MAG: response regulator [Comamonadaceae bacterium]